MTSLLAIIALSAVTGLILGYAAGSKSDTPVKHVKAINDLMNDIEDMAADYGSLSKSFVELEQERTDYKATLIIIRNQGMASKSGTARSMAQKAKAVLK